MGVPEGLASFADITQHSLVVHGVHGQTTHQVLPHIMRTTHHIIQTRHTRTRETVTIGAHVLQRTVLLTMS